LPYFYSCLPIDPNADPFTKLFMDAAQDRWRDIKDKNDEQAEAIIREDKIDILVDLAGHTNGGRLSLFTRKPAPVQVTAWGFAHGTGCPEIDYFFADPVSVTEDERKDFAEKVYDLPCVVSYEELAYGFPENSNMPFAQNGFITFGSCARYEKLSAECLKVLAEIMRAVPDAVLRLKDQAYKRPYSIKRVMEAMPDIDPNRMHFLIGTDHREHMLAYRAADIALDPFPHGGGVVSLEQLYMGVPIITLRGSQPSGRNTASVLTAIGRSEWIAEDEMQYVGIAVKLADDVKTLRAARKTLRKELLDSPVVKGYRESVEKAYQDIWQRKLAE
jgi:predicted O-linked N-acetylglucosamine transferase (SPINDLY family)